MLWTENKHRGGLQSAPRLQCTELISLRYSPKVLAFFISDVVQPPQWGNMKERAECYKDAVVFAICVNLTCFGVFTERSIPKLQGPTLSKMNNLFIIILNLLSFYDCRCKTLTDFLSDCMTRIKVVLLVYFIVTKKGKKKIMSLTSSCYQIGRGGLQCFLSLKPWCLLIQVFKWLWWLIFKHFKWVQSSHRLVFFPSPFQTLL